MPRRAGRLVAGFTSLLVALCTTCGIAPALVLSQALAASAAAPICRRSGDCGSSCPSESQPRPSDCRSCSTTRCGFVVTERAAPSKPSRAAGHVPSCLAAAALAERGAARRDTALAASPPLNLLHGSFRN